MFSFSLILFWFYNFFLDCPFCLCLRFDRATVDGFILRFVCFRDCWDISVYISWRWVGTPTGMQVQDLHIVEMYVNADDLMITISLHRDVSVLILNQPMLKICIHLFFNKTIASIFHTLMSPKIFTIVLTSVPSIYFFITWCVNTSACSRLSS